MKQESVYKDPIVEFYKKDVDRTLLRENLKLTPEERIINLMKLNEFLEQVRMGLRASQGKK